MPHGTLTWVDPRTGIGSITPDEGTTDIPLRVPEGTRQSLASVCEGQRVEYHLARDAAGEHADRVRPPAAATGGAPAAAPEPGRRGSDYAVLSRAIRGAGLLQRRRVSYTVRIGVTLLLLAGGWVAFALIGASWWQMLVAGVLAVLFTQTAFLGHDAGHQQIAASRRANDLIGRLHGNLLVGLGYGWWISKHNRHHAHPNQVDRDPDFRGEVIAFTEDHARARKGMGTWLARHQAWLFFPMLLLEGINLHVSSVRDLVSPANAGNARLRTRLAEGGLLTIHLGAYLAAVFLVLTPLQAVCFIAIHQGLFGLYMGCAFAPNHKGMPVYARDQKSDFLRRQVLTARNIRGGRVVELAMGGLNYQIEHHLFPSMPRPNLRRARTLVRAYCARFGVSYAETTLVRSYVQVLRHLHAVGGPLRPELEY